MSSLCMKSEFTGPAKKDIYEMWEYIMKCVDKYEEDKANEEDETND